MGDIKTEPVKAILYDDIDTVSGKAGAFEYFKSGDRYPAGIIFACPCGCGKIGSLDFRPHPSPSWEWDGIMETPTLSPSVHDPGHWHGYLTAGVWISC